ncbi:matrix-remodeling-associated protein 5 [Rhinophrynus dorsalis]
MKTETKMYKRMHFWLFPVIIVSLRLPQASVSCPHPCACYVNSEVHCTFRSLVAVPSRIPKHVERINLGFNSIHSVALDSFAGLSKLEMLLIHSNNVHNIPNNAFKDLISLQVFKMSYNKLKTITSHTFHGLSGLTRLHVDHNNIEFIHPNAFNGLTSLRLLHLEGNMIQQLHANTFCTFNFLDYFRQSTLKHLYLSDNMIQTLPAAMVQTMPQLENLYLHGNPWTCDCGLKWLLEWDEQSNGVLKCKKDRSYENGQLCSMCAAPKQLYNQEIQSLKDVSCSRPIIYSSLRENSSYASTEEDDESDLQSVPSYQDLLGKIFLNMTDEHGNKVNLDCDMKKPADFSKVQWGQLHPEEIDVNATFLLQFECPMNRENYEKLWKLIAYYSEVPVKLEKELMFSDRPNIIYRYRQNMDHNSYYYTGVKALISSEPSWVMQSVINIQLNRKMSTAKKVTLSFSTQFSQSIHTKDVQYPKNSWVMIEKNDKLKTTCSALKGTVCQLNCNVRSSEIPLIEWSLPDGRKLKAPYSNPENRYSVSASGQLVIKTVDVTDSGIYLCIARVKHEVDIQSYRVAVQPPSSEISDNHIKVIKKNTEEQIMLPCNVVANPDADVSWILPSNNIIDFSLNKTSIYLLNNGSLVIPNSKLTNSGLYRCIAVNQHGTDHFSVQVTINRKVSDQSSKIIKVKKRPVLEVSKMPKYNVIDDDGGSGERDDRDERDKSNIYYNVKDKLRPASNEGSRISKVHGKQNRKDRNKIKPWKATESEKDSNIAEGRRKFESRRRINMGNKQIDPKQWANILAKVRGRNVQKTTEFPLLTTTTVTTAPAFRNKATTPSSIASPPLKPIAESESYVEETSADEDELLFVTSSPHVTISQDKQDLATLAEQSVPDGITEETKDYSENIFVESKEEASTKELSTQWKILSTLKPRMTTLGNVEMDRFASSTHEEEIDNSFAVLEDNIIISTVPANSVQTIEADYIAEHVTLGDYLEEQSSSMDTQTFASEHGAETDLGLTEMESYSVEMSTIPKDSATHYSTLNAFTVTPSPFTFAVEESTTTQNIDSRDHFPDNHMQHSRKENVAITFPPTNILTTPTVSENKQIILNVMENMRPKYISETSLASETTTNADFLIPTQSYIPPVIKSPEDDLTDEKHTKKNAEPTVITDNVYASNPSRFSVKTDNQLDTTTMEHHTKNSVLNQKEMVNSAVPGSIITTHPVNQQIWSTASSLHINNNINYSRRRPNGRRRLRPNRFRHRHKQIIPTVPGIAQISVNSLTQNPFVSLLTKGWSTFAPPLPTKSLDESSYQTSKNIFSSTIATTTKPVVLHSSEKSTLQYFSSTTSAHENSHTAYTSPTQTMDLPLTTTVTTTEESFMIHSADNADNINTYYTLHPDVKSIATTIHPFQISQFMDKTSYDTKDNEINIGHNSKLKSKYTTIQPSQSLYTEYTTTISQDNSVELPTEVQQKSVTESYTVSLTEKPKLITTADNKDGDILKYLQNTQSNLPPETLSSVTDSSLPVTTHSVIPVEVQETNLTQKPEHENSVTTSLENSENAIFISDRNKENMTRPVDYTIKPRGPQTISVFPKKMVVHTPPFYLTSARVKHFPVQTTVPTKKKDHETIFQAASTQSATTVQTVTPSLRKNELEQLSSSQNEMYIPPKKEHVKDTYVATLNNSLLYNTKLRSQSQVTHNNQHHVIQPAHYIPGKGTLRPSYFGTHGPLRYFVTNQPFVMTNKPEITAYMAHKVQERKTNAPSVYTTVPTTTTTTTVIPLYRPKPLTPSRFHVGQRISPNYRPTGNHLNTDGKGSAARYPYNGNPYYINPRISYRFNRTKPSLISGTFKMPIATTNNTNNINSIAKTTFATTILRATAAPVPIIKSTRPPTISQTLFSNYLYTTTPAYTMPTRMPQPSLSIQPNRYIFHTKQETQIVEGSKLQSSNVDQPSASIRPQGYKPRITSTSIQLLSVPFEMDVVIPCETVGDPKPAITWTKVASGTVLSTGKRMQRFEVLENGTLFIQNLQLQDRGQYVCTAQNQHGFDKMLVTLTVVAQQPKMLSSRYKDVTVYIGDTITMDCNASGIPPPHISWLFPDRKIMRTISTMDGRIMLYENGTLLIKETTFSDRGVFKCVASNVVGADSLTVRLHIAALPPIIKQERNENISLPQSHSIYIHCSAKGAPSPSIRWVLFDGTQVRPSQFVNGNVFVFPNGTLYIRNISQKDNGKYECIAANIVGTARRAVILDVKKYSSNAKITASSPQKTDVTYGSTLRLDCSAAGDPWPRILWRLPSKRLVDSFFSFDSRIKTYANGTLLIYSVTEKDAGDYLCMARNKLGDDYVVLKVNVMMKPAKIQYKNDVDHKVIYGGDLKVDCIATGVPNPDISWSLPDGSMINNVMQSDDSGIRTRRYVVFNNGTLFFNEVGMKEEGDYTCYAVNQIGQDEMRVSVKVVAETAIIKNKTFSIVNVPYGDVVTVSCEAKGEPVPTITWLSPANRPIPTLSDKYQVYRDGTLLIQKVQRSDSGNYTCVAQNTGGEDKKIVQIQVNVLPPKINGYSNKIATIKETAMKDSRLMIDCKAEGVPTPRVMWAFPEGVILPAPYYGNRITVHRNGTLDIKALRKSDSVQLVCIGRNEGGEARLVVQLSVTEPSEKPKFNNENENIVAVEGQTVNINCSATGIPDPAKIWILPNGTEIHSGNHINRIYHKIDGTLFIGSIAVANAGIYRCRAENVAGFAERLVNVQIGQKPQMKNHYNNLVSIINGETLQLHCSTHGEPQPHISWTLPNGMVFDGPQSKGRISLLQNGSLVVRDTSVYDRGSYLCKATTQYGSSTMNVPVIVIAYPPRITTSPAPVIYARPGSSVQLNCMSIGIPKAEITWELPDKSQLTALAQSRLYGNKFLHPQGTLVIQHSSKRDTGYYKCTAKNILGSDTKTTYIHIY